MPWKCKPCDLEVRLDTGRCPKCHATKDSWSIMNDMTRTLVIARKKFVLLRGESTETVPKAQAADQEVTLSEAEVIPVLPKSMVKAIHEQDHLPAVSHVVFVALHHQNYKNHDLTLNVIFESQPIDELEFPLAKPADPPSVVYRRLLFVAGNEPDLSAVEFPDLEIVDVTEEDGCAPSIAFETLGRPEQELPTELISGAMTVEWTPSGANPGQEVELRATLDVSDASAWKGKAVVFTIFHSGRQDDFAKDDAFEQEHVLEQPEEQALDGLTATVRWTLPSIDAIEAAETAFTEKHGAPAPSPQGSADEALPASSYAFSYRVEVTCEVLKATADLEPVAPRFYFSL